MRALIVCSLWLLACPAFAQETVVTPTWVQPEQVCYQTIPCADRTPPPCVTPPTATPCTQVPVAAPRVVKYEMRSASLFWSGAALVGAGITFTVASVTWQQRSEITAFPTAPCGTDPYLTRLPIAPCETNKPLLSAGVAILSAGATLMWHGGQKVAIGSDGRQITVRVRF